MLIRPSLLPPSLPSYFSQIFSTCTTKFRVLSLSTNHRQKKWWLSHPFKHLMQTISVSTFINVHSFNQQDFKLMFYILFEEFNLVFDEWYFQINIYVTSFHCMKDTKSLKHWFQPCRSFSRSLEWELVTVLDFERTRIWWHWPECTTE